MQASGCFTARLDLTGAAPTVGDLMSICEENYTFLLRLAPHLEGAQGTFCSKRGDHARLQLEVIEQSKYTTIFRLTYLFSVANGRTRCQSEPDAVLKAYHDAKQVEVLDLRQTALPICTHYRRPALATKWKANLFVSKWLKYCLGVGHRLLPPVGVQTPRTRSARLPTTERGAV